MENRKILILLTQFPGRSAKALRWWTGCPYTHVSIGLDENMNTFYSFLMKGFIVEDIARYNRPGRRPFRCELYAIDVSEETYQEVKDHLKTYVQNQESLHYTKIGLALSLAGIPWRSKNGYICSYFVAEVLHRCTQIRLKRHSTLCMPKDFSHSRDMKMVFRGDLQHYTHCFGNRPYPA